VNHERNASQNAPRPIQFSHFVQRQRHGLLNLYTLHRPCCDYCITGDNQTNTTKQTLCAFSRIAVMRIYGIYLEEQSVGFHSTGLSLPFELLQILLRRKKSKPTFYKRQ
jgi:hypothetical protein